MPRIFIDAAGVSFQGSDVKPGTVIELGELSYNALLNERKGRQVDDQDKPVGEIGEAPVNVPEADPDAAAAAEVEKQRKALNDQYNLEGGGTKPGLKEAALAAGVEFGFDAKKDTIIDAILAQGKAALLIR